MSNHQHPYGKPENVLGFAEDSKVFVRDEPLRQMFLHPDVKHRKIVAFSIIGAYRKGKSFFLDYCLRYLYAHYPSINFPNNPVSNPNDWIGDEDEPLKGFSWHPGTIRVTTGLEVWNDVFLHTDETSGQEIAIFVMDTHGLFDKETSSLDNSRIFTLGTLVSSIQVLNLSGVIQDDQLQYLQFASECAKSAITDYQGKAEKCFQNLTFLIRDWDNPDDYQYGIEGGEKYLKHFMEVIGRKKKELKYVCESIYDSYENINCSLLTHPGKIVSRGKKGSQEYDGNWNGMDEDFKDELIILINFLLNPERLILKKINGYLLNGEDFLEFLLNQLKLFQTDELLKAQTLRDLMTEKEMEALVNSCIEYYKEVGNKNKSEIKTEEDIPALHEQCKNEALEKYDNSKKMGNEEDCTRFRKVLDDKIEQLFKELIIQLENDRKKLEDETEKLRSEMEERQKKKLEKIEKEKKMAEERLEVERQKAKEDLENENKFKEQEIAELNKQNELERIAIEKRKEDERIATERTIEAIHDAVAESKQKYEDFKQNMQVSVEIEELKELQKQEPEKTELETKMSEEAERQIAKYGVENENKLKEQETGNTIMNIKKKVEEEREQIELKKQQEFLEKNDKKLNEVPNTLQCSKMTSALPSLVSDAADFECEYKINDKTQILHQTTTDDDIVTSSEIGKNDKGTSIEDIQNREKGQILKIYFQSELKKILPESYKRDQHQTLNNDKVLTINATNSVVNINCAVPDSSRWLNSINNFLKKWDQWTGHSKPQNIPDTSKIYDLIEKSLSDYKKYIYREKDTPLSIGFIKNLHEMGKNMAIENFLYACKNIKFMNNDKVYVEDLKSRIENIYENSVYPSKEKSLITEYWEIKEQK